MLRYTICLVALTVLFSSCESDFNLIGDYEEEALVYGLLDASDNTHLFRIQKVFLGDESAFLMALEPDSSYFDPEFLRVELIEFDGVVEQNRWLLDTTHIDNKDTADSDDGSIDFFGPVQRLYQLENQQLDPKLRYELVLTKTGGVADSIIANATINLVDTTTFRWKGNLLQTSAVAQFNFVNSSGVYSNFNLRFDAASNAKYYEVWLRFYYREVIAGVETLKTIEWKVKTLVSNGESDWTVPILGENVFSRIGSELSPIPGVIRKIGQADGGPNDQWPTDGHTQDFDLVIRMAGEELYQYIEINNPTNTGAIQEVPSYSNLNNGEGIGVFSSRADVEFANLIYLSDESNQELIDGQYTQGLGFVVDPD